MALDLINTRWVEGGQPVDALDEPGAVAAWLAEHGFDAAGPQTEQPLLRARDVLHSVLERPGEESEHELNDILGRGSVRRTLRDAAPGEEFQVEPGWLPAWRTAVNYLELLGDRPERIRKCSNPDCVLYFYDTSRNGTRRWCSMSVCGNRLKASRHYERTRGKS